MAKLFRYVLLVAVALAFAVSFWLLRRVIGADSPWLGLLLMFYFLGLSKVAEPIYTLRMPGPLRKIRSCEREGRLCRGLLVPQFGQVLRDTPLRVLNLAVYVKKGRPDLRALARSVEAAEASHFWVSIPFVPYVAYLFFTGRPGFGVSFLLIEILFNVYPVLHLRTVRDRLERHLSRRRSALPEAPPAASVG